MKNAETNLTKDLPDTNPAIFLDRDGTINEEMGYINHPDRFIIFPFVAEAIRLLRAKKFKIIVVTNQSGIARGYFTEDLLKTLHQRLQSDLAAQNAAIDAIYYCPHHPKEGAGPYRKECTCRKPRPGMIHQARTDFNIDLRHSYMIGDRHKDIEFAKSLGITSAMVLTGYGRGEYEFQRHDWKFQPDIVGENLLEIARIIDQQTKR